MKLRGFRVELGEIEHALSEIAGVQLAVALVLQDPTGSQRLVAYVTPASIDPAAAVEELKGRLPVHMVPSVVVPMERMPLLPNEKVDRKGLPQPDWGTGVIEEYVAPASKLEAQLQAVWQEVLGQERVSTQANFFALGGNSLQVCLRVGKTVGWHFSDCGRKTMNWDGFARTRTEMTCVCCKPFNVPDNSHINNASKSTHYYVAGGQGDD